jgi:hypothetical protein
VQSVLWKLLISDVMVAATCLNIMCLVIECYVKTSDMSCGLPYHVRVVGNIELHMLMASAAGLASVCTRLIAWT